MGVARSVFVMALFIACASAGDPSVPGGPSDAPAVPPDDGPAQPVTRECRDGELAVAIASSGQITCAPIDDSVIGAAIDASCSVYLGWRDNCDGCTSPPTKWGRAGATCASGAGANNRCTMPSLGGTTIPLFGLDLDGDVDGNDKFYAGLHCVASEPRGGAAPCPPGEYITGRNGASFTCAPLAHAAVEYVRTGCSLYLGWQDSCHGCTTPPTKWGYAGDGGCQNGAGLHNTCSAANLGGESVNLFGLSTDGNVDDNDKFHIGLHCTPPTPETTDTMETCPAGQFVIATRADGSLRCASPAPRVASSVADQCALYFGWRDSCNGCTSPPSKWGHTRVGRCTLGVGLHNTCGDHVLGVSVSMFGLNTDGDVDENDMLYIGLRCM